MATEDDGDEYEVDEDAGSGEDGGSFADESSTFARRAFDDSRSSFATPQTPPVNTASPLVTKEQEEARYETAQPPTPKRLLVCQIDKHGMPWVAQFAGKKRLERWRRPNEDEFNFLKENGRLVKGGIGEVPVAAASAGQTWPTPVKIGVGLAAAFAAYKIYQFVKRDELDVNYVEV